MIIWSSINCPTVICLPTVCYFSREKPLVKPTAPGSSFSYICLAIYFSFAFLFRSIKPKIQKYFTALYFICDLLFQSITTFSQHHAISSTVPRKRLTIPLTRWVASGCYLCAGAVYVVLLGSPIGSITLVSSLREIPTLLCCIIPSSLGKYRCSPSRQELFWRYSQRAIKRNFWRHCWEDIINIHHVPNHKSHLLTIYIICHLPLVFVYHTS